MDRLLQIETFIAVAEHASFSEAARELKVTPAMIGRRIDSLEKRLRVKLFHRSTRHMSLTEGREAICSTVQKNTDGFEQDGRRRHRPPQ